MEGEYLELLTKVLGIPSNLSNFSIISFSNFVVLHCSSISSSVHHQSYFHFISVYKFQPYTLEISNKIKYLLHLPSCSFFGNKSCCLEVSYWKELGVILCWLGEENVSSSVLLRFSFQVCVLISFPYAVMRYCQVWKFGCSSNSCRNHGWPLLLERINQVCRCCLLLLPATRAWVRYLHCLDAGCMGRKSVLPGIAWIRLLLQRKDVYTHVAVALYGRRLRCCLSFGKKF
jgi:hypothetical protein